MDPPAREAPPEPKGLVARADGAFDGYTLFAPLPGGLPLAPSLPGRSPRADVMDGASPLTALLELALGEELGGGRVFRRAFAAAR